MKVLLLIFVLLFYTASSQDIGYLISIKKDNKTEVIKTQSIEVADSVVSHYSSISIKEEFQNKNYFELWENNLILYIEKKEVVKKNNKLKYKKLK